MEQSFNYNCVYLNAMWLMGTKLSWLLFIHHFHTSCSRTWTTLCTLDTHTDQWIAEQFITWPLSIYAIKKYCSTGHLWFLGTYQLCSVTSASDSQRILYWTTYWLFCKSLPSSFENLAYIIGGLERNPKTHVTKRTIWDNRWIKISGFLFFSPVFTDSERNKCKVDH